jgi:hypothetical protein
MISSPVDVPIRKTDLENQTIQMSGFSLPLLMIL